MQPEKLTFITVQAQRIIQDLRKNRTYKYQAKNPGAEWTYQAIVDEIYDQTGVLLARQMFNMIENGKANISPKNFEVLCEAFGYRFDLKVEKNEY